MRLATNNGLTVKNSQVKWLRQDLIAEAMSIASRIRKTRSSPYRGELTSYGQPRVRITRATKQTIEKVADSMGCEQDEVREDLAQEIETRLGVNTRVSIGRWWITVE